MLLSKVLWICSYCKQFVRNFAFGNNTRFKYIIVLTLFIASFYLLFQFCDNAKMLQLYAQDSGILLQCD